MEALGFSVLGIVVRRLLHRADKAAVRSVYCALRLASRYFRGIVDDHKYQFTGPYFNDALDRPVYRPHITPIELVTIDSSVQRDFCAYTSLSSLVVTANAPCSDGINEPPRAALRRVTVVNEYSVVLYMSILLRCRPSMSERAHWSDRVTILRVESSDPQAEIFADLLPLAHDWPRGGADDYQ